MCTCELYTCSLFDASVGNDFSGGHACGLLWVEACLAKYVIYDSLYGCSVLSVGTCFGGLLTTGV
jgi:hypothetical protein